MRKNSIKNIRVNNEVQRVLSDIIRNDIKDPRVGMMTSVTDVYVAPDLKTCKAYISTLGDEAELSAAVEGLTNAEGFIRRELAAKLNLRHTPEIEFIADDSIHYGVKMSKMIDDTMIEINGSQGSGEDDTEE